MDNGERPGENPGSSEDQNMNASDVSPSTETEPTYFDYSRWWYRRTSQLVKLLAFTTTLC